jgi:hypothetical protein
LDVKPLAAEVRIAVFGRTVAHPKLNLNGEKKPGFNSTRGGRVYTANRRESKMEILA